MFGLITDIERAMIKPLVPNVTLITGQVMYTYPMKEILTSLREHLLETFGEQTVELAVAVTRNGDVVITAYVAQEGEQGDGNALE
jgi:hypothetical protein